MATTRSYRNLFSVQVLIDYYLTEETGLYQNTPNNPMATVLEEQQNRYQLEQDLKIELTEESKQILKNLRLIFKKNARGFFVASQVRERNDGAFLPYTPLSDPFALRFTVALNNPFFYNHTNLRMEQQDHFLYYFSNRAANGQANQPLYLSHPIANFDNTYAYEASEIFIDPSGAIGGTGNPEMYEAIENNGPGAFNPNNWRQLFVGQSPLSQFVTEADRIVVRPSIFKHEVESANRESLTFILRNWDNQVVETFTFNTTEAGVPLAECELNLQMLPKAYYQLEVRDGFGANFPDLALSFYADDQLFTQQPFALIECFHEPSGQLGLYKWLDEADDNRLLSPEFTLRWKNRSTWWRYYYEQAPAITGDVEHLDNTPANPNFNVLISSDPLALTQVSREVEILITNTGESELLPNPTISRIYPENGRIFSEINMGGGFGPPTT